MKKIMNDQAGVTLIETVAATAIIAIILVTVIGALLFGQKMVVFSDSKNNEASQAQEMIDEIMKQLSARTDQSDPAIAGAVKVNGAFVTPSQPTDSRKQYYYEPVDIAGNKVTIENAVGYRIYVRVYYNNDQSYVELDAFTKKRKCLSMNKQNRRNGKQGFTLIELLAALLITGILLATVTTVFLMSQKIYTRGGDISYKQKSITNIETDLQNVLATATGFKVDSSQPTSSEFLRDWL